MRGVSSQSWLTTGTEFLVIILVCFGRAEAQSQIELLDEEAISGDVVRIQATIDKYLALDHSDPEVQWRILRAYYNYQDELQLRDRPADQEWACTEGYQFARTATADSSNKPELVYYDAVITGCYLSHNMISAPIFERLTPGKVFAALEKARSLDPAINDAGPDRGLGLLYLELPPPWKDKEKAMQHLENAVNIAPRRGGNRAWFAAALVENGRVNEAWEHIEFIRAGDYTVSSAHWAQIYEQKIEELAQDLQRQ